MEEWKNINGFPFYMVSNFGRVKRIRHIDGLNRIREEKIRKPQETPTGYLFVTLFDQTTHKYYLRFIHRLVAEAFIPNPDSLPIINHKDCNPSNNHYDNLEWCDYSYNNSYASARKKRNATRLIHNPNGECWRLLEKPILQLTKEGEVVREFASTKQASDITSFRAGGIYHVLDKDNRTYKGFIWRRKEPK